MYGCYLKRCSTMLIIKTYIVNNNAYSGKLLLLLLYDATLVCILPRSVYACTPDAHLGSIGRHHLCYAGYVERMNVIRT